MRGPMVTARFEDSQWRFKGLKGFFICINGIVSLRLVYLALLPLLSFPSQFPGSWIRSKVGVEGMCFNRHILYAPPGLKDGSEKMRYLTDVCSDVS